MVRLFRGSSPRPIIEYLTTDNEEGVNWVKIGDVPTSGRIITSTEEKITKEGAKKSRHVYVGDLILSNSMSYGLPYIMGIEGCIHDGWFVLRDYEQNFNKDYLCNLLISDIVQKQYKKIAAGGVVQNISSDLVNSVYISIPSLDEQRKIAGLLSLIDERIATQNKIIEDLKKLKSAISKQVFAQEPNGWSRLDTLFSKGKAGGTPTSTNKEYYNGEIPFLSINDITKQGKYVRYTENHLSQSGLENSSAWVVPKYSLIMSMYASVGLVTINEIPITTSQAMFAMQLKDKDLLDYLYYYLSYFKYRHIHKYLETGTQSNINADIVRGIMIPTYGHSRNMEIASTLQGIDVKIDNELSVLKLFNRQKNYLLSQMFI